MRILNGFLIVLLLVFQYRLWIGEGSIGDILALNKRIEEQQAVNLKLSQRNAQLAAQVIDLQQGHEGIEEYARSQLGLIKPEETFYLVVDQPKQ
jgi:cell division protein FtsB